MVILIHHNELILKGRNRGYFEQKLCENIKRAFLRHSVEFTSVARDEGRIVCEVKNEEEQKEKIVTALNTIFGIKNFAIATTVRKSVLAIRENAKIILEELKNNGIITIKPITKRADKKFPLTSPEINAQIGEVVNELGLKIQYKGGHEIYTEITQKAAYMFIDRKEGLGGMPQGTAGQVLCLHSGGIDSPVAAYLLMKRGCQVDFLHFHSLRNNKEVIGTKIATQIKILNQFQADSKLYTVPYHTYQMTVLGNVAEKYEVVIFRNFMIRYAQKLAEKMGYKALIMGDSVGQVASQTLENIRAAHVNVEIPIFRPLISFDKQEIISIAQKIGTYEESIKQYKDCCSIIAKAPATKVSLDKFEHELESIDLFALIDKVYGEMESFEVSLS
jgi:tRNA uracil 4-sulfurtransferase